MIEPSPPSSSAESSFRELDEVFLQTQTRIWLGELLNTRFDEDLPLSDLLQDGEILFEVSKIVWDCLMNKCMELRHLKHKYGPFGSKKSSGRYRPYSNVDSFLKICKIMGLNGIDLFSPSDVVENRNIRKVCICIRALSKKARSKQLRVPDFDMVICSVTMPTDMVGVIRRSLESSQCTFSSSSSYSSCKGSKVMPKQRNLYAPGIGDDGSSSSDESDEAESRYMGGNSISSPFKFENADEVNSDLEYAPEKYSISGKYRRQDFVESDVKCQSTASDFDKDASCTCCLSKKNTYHGITEKNSEERKNFTHENGDQFMGDSSCTDVGENNYIANYLAFSDLMVHATDSSNSVVLDGENNMFDFFLNVDPQGAAKGEKSFHNGSQRVYSDDEDMEVSSTTSMSSVLGRLLNLEFDNQFDDCDSSSTNVCSSASMELDSRKLHKDESVIPEPAKEDSFHTQPFDSQETRFKMAPRVPGSLEFRLPSEEEGEISLSCEHDDKESDKDTTRGSDEDAVDHGSSECLELSNESKLDEDTERFSAEDKGEKTLHSTKEENDSQLPSVKHKGRPLLKTVVKGTAIAGVIFLLLHIRKSNANSAQERLQNPRSSSSKHKPSSGERQSRSVGKGIYPTEKLKL